MLVEINIKKVNFNILKDFSKNYKLIKAKIISSRDFQGVSKSIQFPIVIGLYMRDERYDIIIFLIIFVNIL
jgi:hypothetical protein